MGNFIVYNKIRFTTAHNSFLELVGGSLIRKG
uniref:Uncharacterized protein n=1 Tax=Siphoviridae sp. ctZHD14 TaxID=2827891 RepID=A0A8S5SWT1_9CAUD|nr:MAG TPA: hypothetical protein [Siphoviridae sp. ctZHD14]